MNFMNSVLNQPEPSLGLRLEPGQRVRVRQTIRTREGDWHIEVEGEVVACEPRPTGSWFAHGKNDRLWLARLILRKDDGEKVELNLSPESELTRI